jgi:hypothetical protein
MRPAFKLASIIIILSLLIGCGGNPPAKSEKASEKTVTAEASSKASEGIPADPYAAMEVERNAVKESLSGKVSEIPQGEGNTNQKVYSGVIEIVGKGSADQTIVLKSDRRSLVLVGEKSAELVSEEGKFITVMGKPTKGNPVQTDLKGLDQLEVEGIVKLKNAK